MSGPGTGACTWYTEHVTLKSATHVCMRIMKPRCLQQHRHCEHSGGGLGSVLCIATGPGIAACRRVYSRARMAASPEIRKQQQGRCLRTSDASTAVATAGAASASSRSVTASGLHRAPHGVSGQTSKLLLWHMQGHRRCPQVCECLWIQRLVCWSLSDQPFRGW